MRVPFYICLMELRQSADTLQVGMQKELEIATAEMDRAQHRLVMLEREKQALERQVYKGY